MYLPPSLVNSLSLSHWLTFSTDPSFSALWNFATHWQSSRKRAEIPPPPPRIYLSFKFWHMLKCNRTTWNPGSYFLGKYSNHKATAQNGEHYHKAHFLLLRTTAKETNWHHFIQTSHSSVSIRHYWECLLDYRELIKTPSSWILSWFVCVRRTRRRLDSPSLQ